MPRCGRSCCARKGRRGPCERSCYLPTSLARTPNTDEFRALQRAAGGRIRILTVAPELPGALDLIADATRCGVRVALGHTDANAEDIHAATQAGAVLSTHLGNGCPENIHRHHNPLWPQLADDRLSASVICDYFHLPADVVKTIYRVKGSGRCLLITDAVHVTGLPPGKYFLVTTPIELLPSGKVQQEGGRYLGGSALTMNRAVVNFMALAGTSLAEALDAATTAPARFLDLPGVCCAIEAGQPANVILFRRSGGRLIVERHIAAGEDIEFRQVLFSDNGQQ